MTAEDLRSPIYDEFEARTLELHALIRGGHLNSRAADELRDALADTWHDLTPDQRRFGNAFSGDLYMLNPNVGETFEPATDVERSPQHLGLAIKAAWDRREWAEALVLLRKGPTFFDPKQLAYLRARAYGELGRPVAALAFVRFARAADPDNGSLQILELDWMVAAGQTTEATSLAWRYAADPTALTAVVLHACAVLMSTARGSGHDESAPQRARLARILRRLAAQLESGHGGHDPDDLLANARLQLGAALEDAEPAAALSEYRAVIHSPPSDLGGVIMRAQLADYVRQRFGDESQGVAGDRARAVVELPRVPRTSMRSEPLPTS